MDQVDCVVIGAGVVGLAVARALAQAGREVVVLEREKAIGQGVSSRNSEVIHAGLYYEPGSLKARLCVRGKELLYAFCQSHGVAHLVCGKLLVATAPEQHTALENIQRTAQANDVPVEWLEADAAMALEPALHCTAALHSPTTGIIDTHELMLALQGDLERAGGAIAFGARVTGAKLDPSGQGLHRITLEDGAVLGARWLVNAASLHACALARNFSGLESGYVPQEYFAKGSYFALAGRSPFSRLIYPAPSGAWLGVHLTLDLGGQARFGPDHEWLKETDPDAIRYAVDAQRGEAFYASVRRYWPGLPDHALQPAYSGVRPKIHSPGTPAPDFRIDGPQQHGVPGLVNLFGIESPGLTSSLAIGEQVLAKLVE